MAIDFSFTADQEAFRTAARAFLQKEVAPIVAEMDEREEFPAASVRRMQEEGYFGIPIPEQYGGLGLGKVGYCLFLEEVGKVDASHGVIVGAHTSLGTTPILYYGTEEQKRRWLVPAAKGERLLAFSLTEPGSGSDSGAVRTVAEKKGDHWVLTGNKIYVSNGREADTVVLLAGNDVKLGPNGGVTAFLVDTDTAGFKVGRCEKKMGLHGTSTAELDPRPRRARTRACPRRGRKGVPRRHDRPRCRPGLARSGLARRDRGSDGRGAAILAEPDPVRVADQRVPGDPVQARGHGDAGPGAPAAGLPRGGPPGPAGYRPARPGADSNARRRPGSPRS